MKISERIFEILKDKGMTQKEFSARTGIPQSTISDWKNKEMNPSADKLLIICQVLQTSVYDILASSDNTKNAKVDYVFLDKDSKEKELIDMYRNLPETKRERLLGYADALNTDT